MLKVMHLGSGCQTTAKGASHTATVLLSCTGENRSVSHNVPGLQKVAGTRAGMHLPLAALINLPGPATTYHHWSDLLYSSKFTCYSCFAPFWLTLAWSSSSLCAQEYLHQPQRGGTSACEKQDLCRNGDAGYTGCLLHVLGTFTAHFYRWPL